MVKERRDALQKERLMKEAIKAAREHFLDVTSSNSHHLQELHSAEEECRNIYSESKGRPE